jgi:hypothetical protein
MTLKFSVENSQVGELGSHAVWESWDQDLIRIVLRADIPKIFPIFWVNGKLSTCKLKLKRRTRALGAVVTCP